MNTSEFVDMLRRLADVYEQNPTISMPYHIGGEGTSETIYCNDHHRREGCTAAERFAETVKAFGAGTKADTFDCLIFKPKHFPTIDIRSFKQDVCERVVVGKHHVEALPAVVIPEKVIPAKPAYDVDIVEWRCKPFTAAAISTDLTEWIASHPVVESEEVQS